MSGRSFDSLPNGQGYGSGGDIRAVNPTILLPDTVARTTPHWVLFSTLFFFCLGKLFGRNLFQQFFYFWILPQQIRWFSVLILDREVSPPYKWIFSPLNTTVSRWDIAKKKSITDVHCEMTAMMSTCLASSSFLQHLKAKSEIWEEKCHLIRAI